VSPSPLATSDCYHVGLVVPDIDAATTRLTAASGYGWTKPIEATLTITTPSGDYDVPFRFVYSLQAPHLEVIQEVPGTVWTSPPGAAAHHLGYWVDDLAAVAAGLEAAGYELEAKPSGARTPQFAYYVDASGVRIELVDRALFPDWPGFLEMMKA
jgi:catechol 2,3-dioxygenase-like lactoylglutathione lyase family enzyme